MSRRLRSVFRILPSGQTKVLIASLIALTSVVGALAAWRATVAGGRAGDEEGKAQSNIVARSQSRSVILSQADAILFDYLRAAAGDAEAKALREQAQTATPEDAARLTVEADVIGRLATVTRRAIDPDALRPDGTLNLARKIDLDTQLAESNQDLDPAPEYRAADHFRRKSEQLVGLTALLIAAALFFTFAQVSKTRGRRAFLTGGVVVLVVSTLLLLVVELA